MAVDDISVERRSDDEVLPSARTLGKGLAVLRIFMGSILFADGVAKVFGIDKFQFGPYVANLIDRGALEFILRFEALENPACGQEGSCVPGVPALARFMLDNIGLFGWVAAAGELIAGGLLIAGLLTRAAALYGLGFALFLALLYASSNRWFFEQPHEYVPFIILALIPTGRVWGLDGKVLRRRGITDVGELRGWPL